MESCIRGSEFAILKEDITVREFIDQKINEQMGRDNTDAAFVADLGDLVEQHLRWESALPRVKPFYSVKRNSSKTVLQILAEMGTGFDCASKNEIAMIRDIGVPAGRIIYANPCKENSHIKYAASRGVQIITFDNEDELFKVAMNHPTANFHAGSGCTDAKIFAHALEDACTVFDIGVTAVINPALDIYFPEENGVKIIAEPGRYYVASSFTLAVNIIARKIIRKTQSHSNGEEAENDKIIIYYVNDGLYGSFDIFCQFRNLLKPILYKKDSLDQKLYTTWVWGPTCDSFDHISDLWKLPELKIGDWLLFKNTGAYTLSTVTTFNGFHGPTAHYVISKKAW